jgi:tricorn protease interacting factor F2/3
LPKLDIIALPDFASGAMENWGAITFREAAVLFDPKTSSTSTKQYLAEVVSHELAHQWFGDLVTMKWWNDLWINESFATFMANKSVDKIFLGWEFDNQFLQDSTANAFNLDALKASHPIDVKVKTPEEIPEIFDEISYDKGGSILRMLEDFVGENVFRDGLRKYLSTHKYGNATTEDLWEAIEKVSGKPVRKMMDTWVKQVGYPVVKVNDSMLTQERFLLEHKPDKTKWYIPLSIYDKKHLMKEKTEKLPIEWTKINFGQKGFYRVEYPQQTLERLKLLIRNKHLPGVDRWGVQNDMFALAMGGRVPVKQYLDLVEYYWEEDDYIVCKDIADNLYAIYLLASKETFWPKIKFYNSEFLEKIFNRLGWEPRSGEKHTDNLLRSSTILQLGRMDDVKTLEVAQQKFDEFLKNPDSLHPDLRSPVHSLAAWRGDKKMHETLTDLYRKAKTQEEKRRLLGSLAGFQDEKLLRRTLDFSLSPDVRLQDTFIPVVVSAANPYACDLLWPWVKKNWSELKDRYSIAKNLLSRIIDTLSLTDVEKEREMAKFFAKHPARGTQMTVKQMIERLRINAKFLENIKNSYSNVY